MTKSTEMSNLIIDIIEFDNKVMIIGNGGSSTMASHFAGELMGQFEHKRKALPAMSLFDLATITAIANDYGYDKIFSRQLEGIGKPGDLLIVLSTSGESKNCIEAIKTAEKKGIRVLDFPRKGRSVALIQEYQLKLLHRVCRQVEKHFL